MFDFNKLDFYKFFMKGNSIYLMCFNDGWELTINEKMKDYDIYNSELEESVNSHDSWETFKKEVANYFLK